MKLLLAYDFSKSSDMALHYAAYIAKRIDAILSVIHVIPEVVVGPETPMILPSINDIEKVNKELEVAVHRVIDDYQIPTSNYSIFTKVGPVVGTLVSLESDYDLIVLGTHDYENFFDKMLGSTSTEFLKLSDKPNLLIHAQSKWPIAFNQIIFAVDASTKVAHALEQYRVFNNQLKAKTSFLSFNKTNEAVVDQFDTILKEYYLTNEAEFVFEVNNVNSIQPQKHLTEYLAQNSSDMLCMVKDNQGVFNNYFSPSFSISTAHKTTLPVLIYKSK